MSDKDDFESESEEDFSASEDEWTPAKHVKDDSDDEAEMESDEIDEDFEVSPPKKRREDASTSSKRSSKEKKVQKPKMSSLRAKMFKIYNPPPKTISPSTKNSKSSLSTCKSIKNYDNDDSDSGSSVENFLVKPDKLDLKSSFFTINKSKDDLNEEREKSPNFDCNVGITNDPDSDDEINDDDDGMESVDEDKNEINDDEKLSPFKQFYDFKNTVDQVREKIAASKKNHTSTTDNKIDDISSLLAMGEAASTSLTKEGDKKPKKLTKSQTVKNSDSEWEEVEERDDAHVAEKMKDNIEITVGLPERQNRQEKAKTDEQAQLMRRLNRIIKENYIIYHKVSLLCHLAHGFYLNRALNNTTLMTATLKLLPSEKSYPNGRTSIRYFESIAKWYKAIMQLKSESVYSNLKKKPSIPVSLALQVKEKAAICKKDFVLIFIVLLRAMGIQCRLVMNLVPLPIRPGNDDLCSLKTKKPDDKQSKSNSKSKTAKDSKGNTSAQSRVGKNEKSNSKQKTKDSSSSSKSKTESSPKNTDLEKESKPKKSIKTDSKSSTNKNINLETKKKNESTNDVKKSLEIEKKESKDIDYLKESQSTHPKSSKLIVPEIKISKTTESKYDPPKTRSKPKVKSEKNESVKENIKISPIQSKQTEKKSPKSRSASPKFHISPTFIKTVAANKKIQAEVTKNKKKPKSRSPSPKFFISTSQLCTKKSLEQTETNNNVSGKKKRTLREKLKVPQVDGIVDTDSSISSSLFSSQSSSESSFDKKAPKTLREKLKIPQLDGADNVIIESKRKPKKSLKEKIYSENIDSDSDFEETPLKKKKVESKVLPKAKRRDRRVLSTDDESQNPVSDPKKKKAMDIWIEVYSEAEDQWVSIDLFKTKVHCIDNLRKGATSPVSYVFAWNNDNSIKDVSPRYCPQWHTVTRKQRVDSEWLKTAIQKYFGVKTARDIAEDRELEKIHIDKPLPTTINEFKNHPLYALERHLLKFEAIYPPNAPTLGFIRGEPIYPRDCVHTLHSREIWLKAAKVVKLGEEPYKIVKARPRWDRLTSTVIKDKPLEIFGFWQTEDYEPPTAENGIVPRNAYGNVELFQPTMLPKKTVHLQLPGLSRICKQLKIDCAPAVIGFDFHQGSCHPLMDGFVICEEFKDIVVNAWENDQERQIQKERDKYESRVYGNWKRLIKGLLIREKLKIKYNFGDINADSGSKTSKN